MRVIKVSFIFWKAPDDERVGTFNPTLSTQKSGEERGPGGLINSQWLLI